LWRDDDDLAVTAACSLMMMTWRSTAVHVKCMSVSLLAADQLHVSCRRVAIECALVRSSCRLLWHLQKPAACSSSQVNWRDITLLLLLYVLSTIIPNVAPSHFVHCQQIDQTNKLEGS
jgi:hypothetical protein